MNNRKKVVWLEHFQKKENIEYKKETSNSYQIEQKKKWLFYKKSVSLHRKVAQKSVHFAQKSPQKVYILYKKSRIKV